jgi:glycosyltransferase involved in cell wall biosynthesis
MRVAILTDNDFGKVNGVTTTLRAVLAHTPADLQVRVYAAAAHASAADGYVALRSPGVGIPFYREMSLHWPRFAAVRSRIARDGADVIHYTTPGPMGLVAQYVAASLRLPMVGSFHTQLAEYAELLSGSHHLGALMRRYLRWPYGQCQRVFVPSNDTRQMLIDLGIRPERLRVWTRGVDTTRFTPSRRSAALRSSWRLEAGDVAVLYVGRLSREKGLGLLVWALKLAALAGVNVRPIFVGDGPFRRELEQQCPGALFTGTLSPDGVADAMASADIFAFPSATETAGNVVLEAQACSAPVIVCDRGGAPEQMRAGESGLVVRSGNPRALADAICQLATDPAGRERLGQGGRAVAMSRSWPRALDVLFATYREVGAEVTMRATASRQPAAPAEA